MRQRKAGEGGGGGSRRPRKGSVDDDDDEEEGKKGISWTHLFLLALMVLGPALPFILEFSGTAATFIHKRTGLSMPSVSIPINDYLPEWLQLKPPAPPPPRERLERFYYKHNPDKMGDIDDILEKYKGREDELFRKLSRKYRTKV